MQIIDYKIEKYIEDDSGIEKCHVLMEFELDNGKHYADRYSFEDLENLTVGLQDILLELFLECRKK